MFNKLSAISQAIGNWFLDLSVWFLGRCRQKFSDIRARSRKGRR